MSQGQLYNKSIAVTWAKRHFHKTFGGRGKLASTRIKHEAASSRALLTFHKNFLLETEVL